MHDATRPTLILIGGSVRAAATDAVQAGYSVVAIDRFGDRDLQAICNAWLPLDTHWQQHLAHWPGVPIVGTGGFPWRAAAELRDRIVAFPAPTCFESLRDPEQLRRAAERCGIAFPPTLSLNGRSEHRIAAVQPLPAGRWLLKPRFGTGGIGIREAAVNSYDDADRSDLPVDLQQWIAGRPLGACYFARQRCGQHQARFLGAFDGLLHRHHAHWRWLYGGSLGPRHLPAACQRQLQQIGTELATRFGLVGLFNVDFLRRRDGSLVLLEINPRYSASMELLRVTESHHPLGTRASLIDWHLSAYEEQAGLIDQAAADQRTRWLAWTAESADQSPLPASTPACKRIIYAAAPLLIDCTDAQLSERFAAPIEQTLGVQVSFHDLPPPESIVPAGAPALTVIVRGSLDATTLRRAAQRIAVDLRRNLRAP